jgi:ABC-type amino acid transport substrate-binding protein
MAKGERPPSSGILYDGGALIAADRDNRRMWAIHARALQRGVRPIVPAGCVVEAWRGTRQANLAKLLEGCEIETLDELRGKRAGALRGGVDGSVSAVDATVVEAGTRRGAAIVTSDRSDIESLAIAAKRRVAIIDI